ELGVEVSIGPGNWPIDLALDAFFSAGDEEEFGLDIDLTTQEFAGGIRKIWEAGNARPYIGGGLAIIRADAEISTPGGSVSDDDIGIGPWFGGGVFWRIGQAFNIGIAGRWSTADVEFDGGPEVDAGGLHAGLLLGWGW
ncbi:MAG TPA: hypothetical protein VFP98_04580, partial [Candidatus Polarisedimenticolia bacterium]|nr:hypothetical protein [Candidatus Polarisedimenticolia bacterium]